MAPPYLPYLNFHIKSRLRARTAVGDTRSRALRQMPIEDEFKLIILLHTVQRPGAKMKIYTGKEILKCTFMHYENRKYYS